MGSNPSQYIGNTRPVEKVSYSDAQSFWSTLSGKTGLNFGFPTEAQWEYACRAGTSSRFNNGGNGIYDLNLDLRALGRYATNKSDGRGGYAEHTVVGSYEPNAWGLYDMHGNVAEWCFDWQADLNSDPAIDPVVRVGGSERIVRGGCWNWCGYFDDARDIGGPYNASYSRHSRTPATSTNEIGLRACLTLEE